MMHKLDVAEICNYMRETAQEVILPYYKNLQDGDIREKSPGDLVTIADEKAEKYIAAKLKDIIPDAYIIGEEAVAKDPNLLELLKGDKPVWVIDPIDGTYNFTHGRRHFGMLLSLVQHGETLAGFGYDILDDCIYYAKKGAGAYKQAKEHPPIKLSMRQGKQPIDADIIFGGVQPWHIRDLNPVFGSIQNLRCCLHDFIKFIEGEVDFIAQAHITPWDQSAMALVVEEMGASVQFADKTPHNPTFKSRDCILMTACDADHWDIMRDAVFERLQDHKHFKDRF